MKTTFYVYFLPTGHYGIIDVQTKELVFWAYNRRELKKYAKNMYKEVCEKWKEHRDSHPRHTRGLRVFFFENYLMDYVVIEKNEYNEAVDLFELKEFITR